MQLASIKLAIKDYKMAEKDFNEAIVLCKYQNDVNRQIGIEKCLATLYDNSNRRKLAVAMEKHCDYLAANIDQISLQQAKVNKVRAAEQAKLLAQQAKVNAVKIAALAKVNTANQAKLAVQVKKEKLREQKYLATLKANTQWPLLFTVTASVETVYKSSGDESLGETETTFALNMPNNK
jgi:regulatory protein YycH of two-component signal transduction system YycFG